VLLRLAVRARRGKSLMGPAALVGFPGTAMEALEPTGESLGHILVQGEIWQATAPETIAAQTSVRVTGFHGDVLEVQPVAEDRTSSAVRP
jgi:membrane-bound ClpP family serine protease